jgi:hypothetical protein
MNNSVAGSIKRNQQIKTLFVIVFILMQNIIIAQGNVYYVATNGSDQTGDGSEQNPWATITYALDNVPDASTILAKPGTYYGRIRIRGTFTERVTVRSEFPYLAQLRNNDRVITAYVHSNGCSGITIEGFDIAHDGSGASPLVIHIDGGGTGEVSNITIKNNVLHDSYDNDILKINNSATNILVEGNMFYNQTGSDEHIDINSVEYVAVQDNVFFNDFAGSGRTNNNNTSSYIVIKDSNGGDDIYIGSKYITVRRNVFLNWEGSTGSNFVLVGEDGNPFHEASDVLVENNLMIGNSDNVMRVPLGVKGGKDIIFRHNTITGDFPALAYAMRLNTESSNPANENIQFYNNVWSDPNGTMGAENQSSSNDFSDTPIGETVSFTLHNNLYWNGSNSIPYDSGELINYTDDINAVIGNPLFGDQTWIDLPRWNPASEIFADGSSTIGEAFEHLVNLYGNPNENSPVIDAADPNFTSVDDILGNPRPFGSLPDIGAYEYGTTTKIIGTGNTTSIEEFYLEQNYPNPFNPSTTIKYSIPSVGILDRVYVLLKVYNVLGNEIITLVNEKKLPGEYEVEFYGNGLPSGIYFYKIESSEFSGSNYFAITRKMILLK